MLDVEGTGQTGQTTHLTNAQTKHVKTMKKVTKNLPNNSTKVGCNNYGYLKKKYAIWSSFPGRKKKRPNTQRGNSTLTALGKKRKLIVNDVLKILNSKRVKRKKKIEN